MPLVLDLPDDDTALTLQEYVDCLDSGKHDLSRQDELVETACHLKRLANNKSFLLDAAFAELCRQLQFQSSNLYAPEVLLLHTGSDYFVRANIWKPYSSREAMIPGFRYDVCHDHNFDILTVGYFGPGYQSRTYTFDSARCRGAVGDDLELSAPELFTLTTGRVALYRAKRDVHIQLPPPSLSVSINLIPRGSARTQPQLQVDEGTGKVSRHLNFSGSEVAVKMIGLLGNDEHLDVLQRLAADHPSSQMRASAIVARLRIAPRDQARCLHEMQAVQPALVRQLVRSEIAAVPVARPDEASVAEQKIGAA